MAARAALDDLPPEAQQELLADFDPMVALEYSSPGAYASALRAAAGYPAREPTHRSMETRRRSSKLVRLYRAVIHR